MQTRHSSVQRSSQTFIITMKVEPDTEADRRLLIQAFDQEENSLKILLGQHIESYVDSHFPGMKVLSADHERYPTLIRVTLAPHSYN
jgi:hypothetical protein